ncbi:MAG: hypothetical protein KDD37_00545 [Bdellovibrionales bacterium]|nr:hypothetical protein [Bdellovibrionales bacterium]
MNSILMIFSLFLPFASALTESTVYVRPIQTVTLYTQPGWEYSNYHKADLDKTLPANVSPAGWPNSTDNLKVIDTKKVSGQTYYKVQFQNNSGETAVGWLNSNLTLQGSSIKPNCPTKPKTSIYADLVSSISDVAQKNIAMSYSPPPLTAAFEADGANKNCHKYIQPDGTYGPSGMLLAKELNGNGKASLSDHGDKIPDVFLNPEFNDFKNLCPNFENFHNAQKIGFWVWIFTALAWDEGKCISNVTAEGTNTLAVSDFQLPEAWDPHRKYRGPGCDAKESRMQARTLMGTPNGNRLMANPKNAIPCAVQIMAGVVCGWYGPDSSGTRCNQEKRAYTFFDSSQSYWQKIRANDSKLKDMIQQFPDCKKR